MSLNVTGNENQKHASKFYKQCLFCSVKPVKVEIVLTTCASEFFIREKFTLYIL